MFAIQQWQWQQNIQYCGFSINNTKTKRVNACLSLINLNNILQNKFYKIGLWALRSSLFHVMMTYATKESLKRSDIQHLQETVLNKSA